MAIMDGWSQAEQREFMTYTDQHGREWEAWGDVKAKLHPASPLLPRFNAPWLPSPHFARFGAKNPYLLTWDYDAMLADGMLAHEKYRQLTIDAASHFNVPNFDPENPASTTAQMKRDIGDPPLPIDPIRAAKAGNGFILGLRPFDPERPGDVKLKLALEKFERKVFAVDVSEFADDQEFAEAPMLAATHGA